MTTLRVLKMNVANDYIHSADNEYISYSDSEEADNDNIVLVILITTVSVDNDWS